MPTIRMTSKRQVTFPVQVCEDLGIGPGAILDLEKTTIGKRTVWIIRPRVNDKSWFGSLRKYAVGKSHDLEEIRKSVGKAVGRENG